MVVAEGVEEEEEGVAEEAEEVVTDINPMPLLTAHSDLGKLFL